MMCDRNDKACTATDQSGKIQYLMVLLIYIPLHLGKAIWLPQKTNGLKRKQEKMLNCTLIFGIKLWIITFCRITQLID